MKNEAVITEKEAEAIFEKDLETFLKEREKQSGEGADLNTIQLATRLMTDIRISTATLGLLHANKLEVRLVEGKDGSDIDDYEMRLRNARIPCINTARCHESRPNVEIREDGSLYVFDDHDGNTGQAFFTGYCCLACLLLDVWHVLGQNGEAIGDQIRELKGIPKDSY